MSDSPLEKAAVSIRTIERRILFVRGERVMLDSDLAALYGVQTKVLNQAVRRNGDRFPIDFMFQLSTQEAESLRSQIVTVKLGRGQHRKYLPHVFTEQGVAMLSSVLKSRRAVQVNVEIMRAFVRLREMLSADAQFKVVFDAIRQLMTAPPEPPRKKIGFKKD